MPLIDYPDPDEIDDETRGTLEHARNDRGEVPAFPLMLANNPAILGPALGQFGEVMYGGDLPPGEKQLAFVVVSQANDCAYCAASHGAELVNAFGLSATQLEAVAAGDYAQLTDRHRAVAEFARQGAVDPKRVTEDHLDALWAVGFDEADALELTAVIAQAAFANTIADVLDVLPADESAELEQYYPAGKAEG